AEDGIRDRNVTGVQTCALPIFFPEGGTHHGYALSSHIILNPRQPARVTQRRPAARGARNLSRAHGAPARCQRAHDPAVGRQRPRSEERRVGKEWSARGWTEPYK